MIATKTMMQLAMILTACLDVAVGQNESFPWYEYKYTPEKVASVGLLDQRVYVTTTGDETTYYSLSIKQQGVQNEISMRFAIQWLRNITQLKGQDYRGVVFQVNTDQSSVIPSIQIQDAVDYDLYRANGGQLDRNQYLNGILLGETGFDSQSGSRFIRDVTGQVIRNLDSIEVNIKFQIQSLDPIGESRLWYRWAFFTGISSLRSEAIRGNPEPYFYSTYMNIADFFDMNEFLNIYYIMLALSLFWWFGYPFMLFWGLWVQVKYISRSFEAQALFDRWPNSEDFRGMLTMGLIWGYLEQLTAVSIMALVTPIPLLAPIVNFLVVLFMYISYQYSSNTNDKRLYYGKESDDWIIPAVIDHDAFFDIHFRGL